MTMIWKATSSCILIILEFIILLHDVESMPQRDESEKHELYLEPTEAVVVSGSHVTFTCSLNTLHHVSFSWKFDRIKQFVITKGTTTITGSDNPEQWSKLTIFSVRRFMTGEIRCFVNDTQKASSLLTVYGIKYEGSCKYGDECITDKAICIEGKCKCSQTSVLLRLIETGYEVCREMIHNLYDPCEYSEQCSHFVDSKSYCSSAGICTCAAWATEVHGKCVAKNEISYSRSQEMYRVGLVAVTCIIIVIVAVSLWLTLKRSCRESNSQTQRSSVPNENNESHRLSNSSTFDITADKPPSYDDLVKTEENIVAPPDFKDALKNSMTARRLLRQVSAPAGQLLSRLPNANLILDNKAGSVNLGFTSEK